MFDRFYFFNHLLSSFLSFHSLYLPSGISFSYFLQQNVIIRKDCQRNISFVQTFFTFISSLLITIFSTSWKSNQVFRKLTESANDCFHKYFSSWHLFADQFLHQLKRCRCHHSLVSRLLLLPYLYPRFHFPHN